MTNKIEFILKQEDFETKRDYSFRAVYVDLFAHRKGKNFVFPRRDYFFFHDIDKRKIDLNLVIRLHREARDFVNSLYKMPKALRFTVPNIASVFYSQEFVTGDIIEFAQRNTRSVIGGEIQQIFAIDFKSGRFYSQGTNTVRVMAEGASVKMKFNKIDPQNRAFYIVEKIVRQIQ
ncbi:MAG: hypothetical protein HY959_00260 [Ignavibacteriae bacterium]|nr:hypothetical protein [Ignavibacteriota bacterium]